MPLPETVPYPSWVIAAFSLWPLFLILPWLLFLWLFIDKDWRFWAADEFRDKGCDEHREARYWKHEQKLAITGCFVLLNSLFVLFLYLNLR